MAGFFETCLTRQDKDKGLKISSGAHLLPTANTNLRVMDRISEEVLVFEYQVSGRETPVICGQIWRQYIRGKDGTTIILSEYGGARDDIHCVIEVR